MRFTPPLRGALMIFGSVLLLECLLLGAKLAVKGVQQSPWEHPGVLIAPIAVGLVIAVGKGLLHVRKAKETAPGAVSFDRFGFWGVSREGVSYRVSWRLLKGAVLEERPVWRWRFILKGQPEVLISSEHYSREEWKGLSGEFARRLKRRNIEVRVVGAGQLPEAD